MMTKVVSRLTDTQSLFFWRYCGRISMPKGWLDGDKRESDSERRAKPQRRVVSSACLLSMLCC
jgi:hypothetical protein